MRRIYWSLLVLSFAITSSCNDGSKSGSSYKILPSTSGKPGELLVVLKDEYWNGEVGDSIRKIFKQPQYGLPQPEPIFTLSHVPPKGFASVLKRHRNLLILKKGDKGVYKTKNEWSKPQVIITLVGKNEQDFLSQLSGRKHDLIQHYNEVERNRLILAFSKSQDLDVVHELKTRFHLSMVIPKSFYLAKAEDDFFWIRNETADISHGIMVYFSEGRTTQLDSILALRDSVSKKHITSETEGAFMQVEQQYPPAMNAIKVNGQDALEIRGLWRMDGDFMGGPFLNFCYYDAKNNRTIYLDGFVYAPKFTKREYLRQLEAILWSLEVI